MQFTLIRSLIKYCKLTAKIQTHSIVYITENEYSELNIM